MASAEETKPEAPNATQLRWCHLVMSNPRGSLLTRPKRRELAAIPFEHFLHDDRPDLAYSATTFTAAVDGDDIAAGRKKKSERMGLGVRVLR